MHSELAAAAAPTAPSASSELASQYAASAVKTGTPSLSSRRKALALGAASLGLAACGGGGGGSGAITGTPTSPTSPTPPTSPASPAAPTLPTAPTPTPTAGTNFGGVVIPEGTGSPAVAPVATSAQAARFLSQATYGATSAQIQSVLNLGYEGWLSQQFATPSMDTHWDYVARGGPSGCTTCDSRYINATMESFWKQAVQGPDQLRQRMVLALSEIFVVSTVNSSVDIQPDAHASYLDMLARNVFGNFRTLLAQVSTHPTMGRYLSHLGNDKEDPATGRQPDENYAREVMQLFSIGLWQLNADGTHARNATGEFIPTYAQADVMGMARVFTGWSWGGPDASENRWNGWSGENWREQMQAYPAHHSTAEKRFLGVTLPAGTGPVASFNAAIDALFNHANTAPFIGAQLIKRLVTSNPSKAYIARVSAAFAGGGGTPRGDMQAVIRAVLMDPEARDPAKLSDPTWGKLREPLVRYGNFLRCFNAQSTSGVFQIWNLEDPVSSIGQNPLRAPSVFNWFKPTYAPPGAVIRAGLTAPEFQITHETTVTGYANAMVHAAERQTQWYKTQSNNTDVHFLGVDYTAEMALAATPSALLDRLNLLLAAGQLSAATLQTISTAINSVPAAQNSGFDRVAMAVALVMVSPDYIVQK